MSDERRQQPTVNLQELERQLREAARARQRAQATADTLSGQAPERASAQPIPNPPAQPAQTYAQPGLPLSAPPQPAPLSQQPVYQASNPSAPPQPAPASFRPLTPPPAAPAPSQPAMPAAQTYFNPPPAQAREPVPAYAPSQTYPASSFDQIDEETDTDYRDTGLNVLKTDRMGNVYPEVDGSSPVQDQFYSAAAYEEPAANAYDRYTEDQFPPIERERRSSGIARLAIWLVLITILGSGGYFAWPMLQGLVMSGSQTAKAPPLIKADPAPVKVEPEAQPQDNANAPKDIFTKHANEDPNAAQIAPAAEQPADVNAAVKAGAASQTPSAKPPIVPLVPGTGEPRVVKTVTVRADGSIIPEKSDPALAAKATPPGPKVVTMPQTVQPLGQDAPVAASSEPAIPAKPVAVSPEFVLEGPVPLPPERNPEGEQDFSLPLDTITTPLPDAQAAQPAPAAPAAAAPVPAPVATTPGKDFAVQFGAPETEAKGNELKARVEKQFATALSGGTVAVVRGESNGRPVFRVRAIGYSREEANAVCQQVTAAGGQCFVSRNI